jgi:hypothetical protein
MANMGRFVLTLINAEGDAAVDPNCTVEFVRLDQVKTLTARNLQFPPDHGFRLPAFPQAQNLHCAITPSLYRMVQSEFFTLNDGEEKRKSALVARDPDKWQPAFTRWNSLPLSFNAPKTVLANQLLKLKHGPDVGVITPAIYDGMSSPALLLAKMAMLNLFVVLSTQKDPVSTQPWFNFVNRILVIDQERFVAVVGAGLFDSISQISSNLGNFSKQGFFPGDSSLHLDNIPSEYEVTAPMISVKCRYEQGNVQFTMSKVRNVNGDSILLDCDMDEHSNVLAHVSDLFTHAFTGGTNPIDIHEYIVHHQKGIDLGYELNPSGEPSAVRVAA